MLSAADRAQPRRHTSHSINLILSYNLNPIAVVNRIPCVKGLLRKLAEPSRDILSASDAGKPDRPIDFRYNTRRFHTLELRTPIERCRCDTL